MATTPTRRADFLMALAYATDLATGQSRDFALRSCVLAMRLADAAGLGERDRRNVYHQALLRYIGCNADTHLLASKFGDEIALRQDLARIDMGSHSQLFETFVRAFKRLFSDTPPAELAGAIPEALGDALHVSVPILAGHCEVAQRIGARLGLSEEIRENLAQLYERWDGHGLPHGLKGGRVSDPDQSMFDKNRIRRTRPAVWRAPRGTAVPAMIAAAADTRIDLRLIARLVTPRLLTE
jgi:hypothetical protein